MKLKIVSDGTINGTQVVDAITGEHIDRVTSITWHVDTVSQLSYATIVLKYTPAEMSAELKHAFATFPSGRWFAGWWWLRIFKDRFLKIIGIKEINYVVRIPQDCTIASPGRDGDHPGTTAKL